MGNSCYMDFKFALAFNPFTNLCYYSNHKTMKQLFDYFSPAKLESIEFTFFDDKDNEVKVYVTYQKDDPLCLAGLSIRRTKIAHLEWVIKDEYFLDDFTVLFDAIREAVRLEERNDCEFVDF